MTNQNDTDPQSPRARASRSDPVTSGPPPSGPRAAFGDEPPRVKPLTPLPSPSSIETLLDGITGPRPPASKSSPGIFATEIRATPVTRHAPMLGAGERAQDTTVYTARRAMVRNTVAVFLSGALVALLLLAVVRWADTRHRLAPKVEGVTLTPPPEAPASSAPPAPAAPEVPAVATIAVPVPASSLAPPPKATASARKAVGTKPAEAKKPAAHGEDLDDLNRQIRH